MFARDRDLWALEPNLFTDVRFTAQRTLEDADAVVAANGVSLGVTDTTLTEAGVVVGSVLNLSGVGYVEVTKVTGDTQGEVSRLRPDRDGPPLPVHGEFWSGTASGWTFGPQIGAVHRTLLAALGLDPEGLGGVRGVSASAVLNAGELAHVEALGALHLIYAAVAPLSPPDAPVRRKAEAYADRYDAARRGAVAVLDLTGDGTPDATRLVSLNTLRRA